MQGIGAGVQTFAYSGAKPKKRKAVSVGHPLENQGSADSARSSWGPVAMVMDVQRKAQVFSMIQGSDLGQKETGEAMRSES